MKIYYFTLFLVNINEKISTLSKELFSKTSSELILDSSLCFNLLLSLSNPSDGKCCTLANLCLTRLNKALEVSDVLRLIWVRKLMPFTNQLVGLSVLSLEKYKLKNYYAR